MPADTQQLVPDASLDVQIEALLFASGSSMRKAALAKHLNVSAEVVGEAIHTLAARLGGGATRLVETADSISLATAPSVSEMVTHFYSREFKEDIGDAGLEVLAIVLYRGKTSRASIDYIRGVNSAATIRQLSMRGLIERASGTEAAYQATPALLSHLGILHVSDLPHYAEIQAELAAFEKSAAGTETAEVPTEQEAQTEEPYATE